MSKMLRCAIVLLSLLMAAPSMFADTYVKREVRSVWMATVWALDWPTQSGTSASVQNAQKQEMIRYLDVLKADNFNAVYFQVRSMCDAMYRSSYEPWSSYLVGTRGSDPGWDPLAFVVEECHKRGMECHAWVNPYRFTTGSNWNTPQDQELKNKNMLLSHESTVILNPGLPATREHIVKVCREITKNYDIDGIIFDDYFYPNGIPSTSEAGDYTLWKSSGTSMSFGDWRRDNVNQMVRDVYNMIQEEKPYVKFGISPAGAACTSPSVAAGHGVEPCPVASDWQYNGIFSDPVAWIKEGTIDYISPQLYWDTDHATNPFGPLTDWWSYVANKFGRHHYASHSISALSSDNTQARWQEYGKQIDFSREYTENNAPGAVLYSAAYVTGKKKKGLGEWLLANRFQHPALTPAIDWKTTTIHGKVEDLLHTGTKLTWAAVDNVRYSVYAIPENLGYDDVQSDVVSGIKSDYLLDVTYTNSYELPEAYRSGYYYAVCVLDRYGNEYAARYTNESNIPADKVTLLEPVEGAEVGLNATFRWTEAADGIFKVEISTDADFSTVVLEKADLTTNSVDMDLIPLEQSKTYYWRVRTSQPGCYSTLSDVATFKTKEREPAEAATLLAPADKSTLEDLEKVEFSWSAVDGCTYRVDVALDADFRETIYTEQTEQNSLQVALSSLRFSKTLYWRVITEKPGYNAGTSAVWSFTTPTRPMAPQTELYSPADNVTISDNFLVEFKDVAADGYTMQVSSASDFSEGVINISTGWTVADGKVRATMPLSRFANGSYYWRVMTTKKNCENEYSSVRRFEITNSGAGAVEPGYEIICDAAEYSPVGTHGIRNLWVRSVKPEYNNMTFRNNGSLNRSFVVIDNVIYVSGREDNASGAACYLDKYDALTGAYIGRLDLDAAVQGSYYPCNTVMKDDAGNLLVSNLTLNIASTPLRVHQIDKETGEATLRAECLSSHVSSGRVDHCAVHGDVESGDFFVLVGVASGTQALKWYYEGGEQTGDYQMPAEGYYPVNVRNFGIAPRVFPINADEFFLNGGEVALTRYNFRYDRMEDSFAANENLAPASMLTNGGGFFTFDGVTYVVYPDGDSKTENGHNFRIVKTDSDMSFASMTPCWIVPQQGLGSIYSSTYDALVDYEVLKGNDGSDICANVYLYVPGNGLAAYAIYGEDPSGVADVEAGLNLNVWLTSGRVHMSQTVDVAEVYNMSGALVARGENVSELELKSGSGIYVVRCQKDGLQTAVKVAIR